MVGEQPELFGIVESEKLLFAQVHPFADAEEVVVERPRSGEMFGQVEPLGSGEEKFAWVAAR